MKGNIFCKKNMKNCTTCFSLLLSLFTLGDKSHIETILFCVSSPKVAEVKSGHNCAEE
jgi:hypothetical protein